MKKIILFIFVFIYISINSFSQSSDICGIWAGNYLIDEEDNILVKTFIKINKYDDEYIIKVKEVYNYNDKNTKTKYWNECSNIQVNENTISWTSFSHEVSDWDNKRINGKLVAYAKYYNFCSATINKGIMTFNNKIEGFYYDINDNKIGEHHQNSFPKRKLYKDEDNW